MTKYKYTEYGSIYYHILEDGKTKTGIFHPEDDRHKELLDSDIEISPYVEPVKTAEQLKAEVVQELKSLDASPRTITEALLGDQWAIDELKRLEAEKVILRDKLKSL